MLQKNRSLKKLLIIGIVISLLYSFFESYTSSTTLDKSAYITAIGIDIGDIENYKVSFQISTIHSSSANLSHEEESGGSSGSGSSSSSSSNSASFVVNTVECDSIDNGISLMNTYIDKTIDLSHCRIVVISESLAKNGLSKVLYALVNKIEIRPDCNIIISRIPDDEFTDGNKPSIQDILADFYDVITSTENISGYTENITLNKFYSLLQSSYNEPFSALGTVRDPKKQTSKSTDSSLNLDKAAKSITSTNTKPIVESLGLCVFKGDKLVGTLSGLETMCHLILIDELDTSTISIPSPFENNNNIDLSISQDNKPKIKVDISNGSPYVTADITITAQILSLNSSNSKLTPQLVSELELSARQYLADQIYNYYYKTSKDFNSDISGVGQYSLKNFNTIQEWNNYDWLSNYSSCTFKVNLNLSLESGYILTSE